MFIFSNLTTTFYFTVLTEFHSLLPVLRKPFRPSPFKTELLLLETFPNESVFYLKFKFYFLLYLWLCFLNGSDSNSCMLGLGYTLCLEKQKVFNDDIFSYSSTWYLFCGKGVTTELPHHILLE